MSSEIIGVKVDYVPRMYRAPTSTTTPAFLAVCPSAPPVTNQRKSSSKQAWSKPRFWCGFVPTFGHAHAVTPILHEPQHHPGRGARAKKKINYYPKSRRVRNSGKNREREGGVCSGFRLAWFDIRLSLSAFPGLGKKGTFHRPRLFAPAPPLAGGLST